MKQNINLIIFDMDGVLLDTREMYINANQEVFNTLGVKVSRNSIEKFLGGVAKNYFANFLPHEEVEQACSLLNKKILTEKFQKQAKIIPGVIETVKALSDRKLTIVTNSVSSFVKYTLKKFDIYNYFSFIIAADSPYLKKTERCQKIMEKYNIKQVNTILVGDLLSDIETARSVGIRSCLIYNKYSWLYPNLENDAKKIKPDYIIKHIGDLKNII